VTLRSLREKEEWRGHSAGYNIPCDTVYFGSQIRTFFKSAAGSRFPWKEGIQICVA